MTLNHHLTPEHEAVVDAGQGGPVCFDGSRNQYVVMRRDVYEAMLGISDEEEQATRAAIERGLADIEAGRTQDAGEFLDELARKYES